MKRYLDKYAWISFISAKSNIAYLGEVASRVVFLGIILYIFLRLWQVTYSETGAQQLGGLTLAQMLWYLAITESIIMSTPRVASLVDQDVRTGELAVHLIKPLSYPLYVLSHAIGERVVRISLNLCVSILLVGCFVGPIEMGWQNIVFLLLALPLAFVLDFCGYFLVGLGAFWMEDTTGLQLIYSRITMILGGMLIPMELFPEAMQPVLRALPFANVVYGPARMFVEPNADAFIAIVCNQLAGIAVMGTLVMLVYRLASRRIFANGG